VTILGFCAGQPDLEACSEWGEQFIKDLQAFGLCMHGVPSHDTLSRFWRIVDSKKVTDLFARWMAQLQLNDERMSMDGKTLRGTKSRGKRALHMVQLYAVQASAVIAFVPFDKGVGGEKAAAEQLLDMVDLEGKVVTADAGFATQKIADAVVSQGGTLMVGLKPNQPTLFDEAENFMEQAREVLPDEAGVEVYLENIANDGHGRSVEYTCTVCNDHGWLRDSMEHQG
jgi:predicted transposase YbfD/YdcC